MREKKLYLEHGINDADYQQRFTVKGKTVWECPYVKRWGHMLDRCYSEKLLAKFPAYIGCKVVEEWLTFSNFKAWMEAQDWEGKFLDKDLLGDGKLYSKDTCLFVSSEVNQFIKTSNGSRGEYPIGVGLKKETGRFSASTRFKCRLQHIGYFSDPFEAHRAWQKRKIENTYKFISEQSDEKVIEGLLKFVNKIELDYENNLESVYN